MKRLIGVLIIIIGILLPTLPVSAQNGAGQGLEISPPLIELSANPGDEVKTQIRLRNVTNGSLVTKAQTNDFVAAGEDGQPKLLLDETEQSPYSIKDWLTTIPSVTLQPQEQKTLEVTMNVPEDVGPGGHYGVVRFTGLPPEVEDTGVSLSASVGTLILVNVSGNISEQAKIAEFYTAKGEAKRWLFEYGPINLVQKIQNDGNVHIKPKGSVRVLNMFGKEVKSFQLNEAGGNVLPGSTRKFEQTLEQKFMFGRYRVQADVVYGSENKIISRTISFWVIPYKLIFITLLVIVLIIFLIKRYNKYIVGKARKSSSKKDGHRSK